MPTPRTRPRSPPARPTVLTSKAAAVAAAAALFAAAELGLALTAGRFFDWQRADPLLFHAFRPWLLLIAGLLAARAGWRSRAAFYAGALVLATTAEASFLLALGARAPWEALLLGLAGGAAVAVGVDLLVQLGRRLLPRGGIALAGALLIAIFAFGGVRAYERLVLPPLAAPAPDAARPELMLMTGLPIVWGEGGAFDPSSRPAAAFRVLDEEYRLRLLDRLDGGALGGDLLLLAQPHALRPAELVAVDEWVRRGGRVVVLTDPALAWPSELPVGDVRRPPSIGLLGPLLERWGLALEPPPDGGIVVAQLGTGDAERRLALAAPGRFRATGRGCRLGPRDWLARCRVGEGRALLLADADMLHDLLWAGPGARGDRYRRTADNPLLLADWIDELAGVERPRIRRPVDWVATGADRTAPLLAGWAPILAVLAGAAVVALRRRRRRA